MVTIGIDQSYNCCGFVVIDESTNLVLEFGTFSSKDMDNSTKIRRAVYIAKQVEELVLKYQTLGEVDVGIEGLAYGMIGSATRDLAGLQFIIIAKLNELEIEPLILSPKSVKKLATGGGKADKNAMVKSLPQDLESRITAANYKKTTGLYDIADAFWIASLARYEKSCARVPSK